MRFEGEHYQIKAAIRAPVMGEIEVPILLGAFNHGMLGVAGRVADGVIGHGLFTDRYWDERVNARLDETAKQAGRDPDALRRWGWLITAIDDVDPKRAARDARRMIAFYLTVKTYDSLVELHGWQEPVAKIRAAFAKGDTDAMAEAVTDEILDAIAIHGTLEEARQRLAAPPRPPRALLLQRSELPGLQAPQGPVRTRVDRATCQMIGRGSSRPGAHERRRI